MRPTSRFAFLFVVVLTSLVGSAPPAAAQAPITPGNLVLLRVGDGTGGLNSTTTAVGLVEVATDGTLNGTAVVQTIDVASAGASALTLRGNWAAEGVLSLSADGRLVTFGGYRVSAGSQNPTGGDVNGQVPRAVGVLNLGTGVVNTSQTFATGGDQSYWNTALHSVATDDGSRFWTSGAGNAALGGGVRYLPSTTATATVRLGSGPAANDNTRQVQVLDGRLFAAGAAAAPGRSVFQVGAGLPTAGDQTFTNTAPLAGTAQYHSFYFTNLGGQNWNGTGFDTLYATDTQANQLAKFSFDGTNWVANGTLTRGGLTSIVGFTNGSAVTLYATDGNFLLQLVDGTGFNTAIGGSFTPLLAADPNTAFRGITFAPVPEPAGVLAAAAIGLAGWGPTCRRSRKPA